MRKTFLTALTASFLAAGAASAASPTPGDAAPGSKHAEWRQQLFERIDTDHDGAISRAEYQAWIDGRFSRLDANGDGVVDADEIAASPATAKRVQKRAERFVRHYDTSGSGNVSKADFEAREMKRFDRLGNGADSITEDEFKAAHARGFKHHRDSRSDND
jgi:Ca2+-binding EF-hand superfamily protein